MYNKIDFFLNVKVQVKGLTLNENSIKLMELTVRM
jgi:hypothetical protein